LSAKRKLLFIGPVLTASGYGVHARQLLGALMRANDFDVYVESLRWGETGFLNDDSFAWIRTLADRPKPPQFDVAVQCTIPNEFKRRAPLHIGVTAGIEVDRVSPHWILKCNQETDLVIVPSEHSRNGFMVEYSTEAGEKLRLQKPIFVLAEGVDTDVYRPSVGSSGLLDELGGVAEKNFVFCGLGLDKPEGRDRKNVTRLVEWFSRTFKGNERVGLILKTSIVNSSAVDFEITKKRVKDIKKATIGDEEHPKIFVIHGRVSEAAMAGIYNDPRVIAAISLTHGEGFGLPLIEAAACGIPVMATDWSGHLDFLSKDGKKLFVPIEYDMQEIWPDCVWEGVMEAGTRWAVPKESDACTKMQKMAISSDTPRKWASELSTHIHERYNLDVTGRAFSDLVRQAADEVGSMRPTNREDFVKALRAKVRSQGPSLVYTMPMSTGDVFLSTGVVKALRDKHPGHRVYFATSAKYFDIVKGLQIIDELIEWQPWMQEVGLLEDIFDEVYTPNLAVQMTHSNWVHRGKGRNLIDEFAAQCGVEAQAPVLPLESVAFHRDGKGAVIVHAGGQKSARAYAYWSDLVKNLRANGLKVVQVGAKDDISIGEVDQDLRGQTNHAALIMQLSIGSVFVGIDSYPMHVANAVGLPVVAIFGSSYAKTTGPKDFLLGQLTDADMLVRKDEVARLSRRLTLIETPDRNGCERACYKDVCKVDSSNPCLNNIKPQNVFQAVAEALGYDQPLPWKDCRPKIAGYTHILNPLTHGYPYLQSIESMLGFCDEVIIVDGGSTDGSKLKLDVWIKQLGLDERVKVITREWDPEEPGMDGMQKAFGRAMVSPDVDFLWQQDADEIVHEGDYDKIVDICRRFPSDVDLLHLPVIELWGDAQTCRTDRHSWKWRLSRNNLRITHGINQAARLMDPKTGRFYAKPGMSDGCEYIDMVSGEHLPHRGFYNNELEELRRVDPTEYGRRMNAIFDKLPSVWHYSWADLPRKVRNFRDFWDKQWQVLYQTQPQPRFPNVVTDFDVDVAAEQLRQAGGEHGPAPTFKLTKGQPKVMDGR
jgi:ADP-heptose:LPS heptosyltransferase/glycosyltransferase involved in cell wall biosynthesis